MTASSHNPYELARREWNERYRSFVTAKRNWQILASLALVSNALLGLGVLWLGAQSTVVPYVVRVDEAAQTVVVGPAEAAGISDPQILAWQLQAYVHKVRQVTGDRSAQKQILEEAYRYTAGPAVHFLNEHFRASSPFDVMRDRTTSVAISSVLRVSDHTWQIDWVETHRSLEGREIGREHWTGQFSVEVTPPRTPEEITNNPLGFYVTRIAWSRKQ